MSYNKFTLERVVEQFNINTQPWLDYLAGVKELPPSVMLKTFLEQNHEWALSQLTEKARSELMVMPILADIRNQAKNEITIFSGKSFDVDTKLGLKGLCDFIVSKSSDIFVLRAPIAAIVEAKKGAIEIAWGQCAAEMIAARLFNEKHKIKIPFIYGVVTSGDNWQFLKLDQSILYIQPEPLHYEKLGLIMGLLFKFFTE